MSSAAEPDWSEEAKRLVKAEMQRRDFTYAKLAAAMNQWGGDPIDEKILRNKVNRGAFSAGFFMHAMLSMGSYIVRLGEPHDQPPHPMFNKPNR